MSGVLKVKQTFRQNHVTNNGESMPADEMLFFDEYVGGFFVGIFKNYIEFLRRCFVVVIRSFWLWSSFPRFICAAFTITHRFFFYLDYLQRCVTTSERISTVFEEEKKPITYKIRIKQCICLHWRGKEWQIKRFFFLCRDEREMLCRLYTCFSCTPYMLPMWHEYFPWKFKGIFFSHSLSEERESKSSCLFTEDSFFFPTFTHSTFFFCSRVNLSTSGIYEV